MSPQVIYNITTGKRSIERMGLRQFMRIAHALGMTADELVEELGLNHGEDK